MKYTFTIAAVFATVGVVTAQSTFSSVNDIFQANCTVGCHNAASPSGNLILDTDGDLSALYATLVNVTPTNPAAASKGYKLIDPGYPANSFLVRKCAYNAWDDAYALPIDQGSLMPQNQNALAKEDIELIRQWVLYGAPQNGQIVDPQVLDDYYNSNGMARIARPAAPAEGEGYQLHLGPFFLAPGEEVEFYKKEKLLNPETLNVVRYEATFNDESHHYLLFQFDPGTDASIEEGMRPVTVQNAFQDAKYIAGWVDSDVTNLPTGTAYKIIENGVLDLNYHLINYASNGDSVLAADAYVNFYVDDSPNLIEMKSELLINLQIFILNNGQEQSYSDPVYCNGGGNGPGFCNLAGDSIYVWFLSSHTHKYGTDYDLFKRNANGSKGEQIYEGFYNTTYDFNQGYYDWEHPGNLYFDELIPIAKNTGIIQEAKFRINDPNEPASFINFGLTTNDEMMLAFIQYTMEPLSNNVSVADANSAKPSMISVYPNPSEGQTSISYTLIEAKSVNLEVYNGVGQLVSTIYNGTQAAGRATHVFAPQANEIANGLYFIRLNVDGEMHTQRFVLNQ